MKTLTPSDPKPLSDYVSEVAQLVGFDEEVPRYVIKHIQSHEQDGHHVLRAARETKMWLGLDQ